MTGDVIRGSSHDARLTRETCAIYVYVVLGGCTLLGGSTCPENLEWQECSQVPAFHYEHAWSRGKDMPANACRCVAYYISLWLEGLLESGDEVMIEERKCLAVDSKKCLFRLGQPENKR